MYNLMKGDGGCRSLVEGSVQLQPRPVRTFYVYILTNNTQVLYIGVTSNLDGRLYEHIRDRDPKSFSARYNLDRLVYYEDYPTALEAIAREKQLKGWSREKKKKLIRQMNPSWRNLLEDLKFGMMEIPGGLW
jgi:putative endonuclease